MSTLTISNYNCPKGVAITGAFQEAFAEILTPEALTFLKELHTRFNARRLTLLQEREARQHRLDAGELPDFLPETRHIRTADWTVAPLPADILDRRVEITGPVDRKMIINALNSGAKVFMADFEDSNSPMWTNNIEGQINLRDAIRKEITYQNPDNGKYYSLNDEVATLFVRPRGWHLNEKHILINGEIASGGLVDFGLYFFHNVKELNARGTNPYFYLPKMENHLEARLWNDVFVFAQLYLNIPQGTIKATVLIETILAAFELNEILWELREHSAGLNCGRWDYIFSFIKKLRNRGEQFILPDRAKVTMTVPFMAAYVNAVIQTCHRRNVHAMGGMAAQIPIKSDVAANEAAIGRVKADKLREVTLGHDGTWVAHPGLVPVAMEVFNQHMKTPNQLHVKREDVVTEASELLKVPNDSVTEGGLRANINVGILYIESWLRGNGAAALHNLMEDAATAEISRTQVWQWIKNGSKLEDGRTITYELYREILPSEIENIKAYVGENAYQNGKFEQALELFDRLVRDEQFIDFLTLPAYDLID